MVERLLPENKWVRYVMFLAYDVCAVLLSSFLSLWVRFDLSLQAIPAQYAANALSYGFVGIVSTISVFAVSRMYATMWKSAGIQEAAQLAVACAEASALQLFGMILLDCRMPRSYYVLWFVFLLGISGGGRMGYRLSAILSNRHYARTHGIKKRVMVVGAGEAGAMMIKELKNSDKSEAEPVCVIDDDPNKFGKYIAGVPVRGSRNEIESLSRKLEIDEIYVATPAATAKSKKEILEICQRTGCGLKILPGIYQLANGEVSVTRLRKVELEDLLGREPIKVNLEEIMGYVKDKVVLVTGGGGSIGSELCRQLSEHGVKRLIVFDVYENNAYEIEQELKRSHPEIEVIVLIGSVRNSRRVEWVLERYKPSIIYHAAAHKHVPLMEESPNEAVKNNVLGTYETAKAAIRNQVERFILISTDKAVNPTNIMGASKRLCEMIIQMCNEQSETEFVAVRFGNVLGSNGSVIPLFKEQIEEGGPLTVTDREIMRYFMTIPEAVSLVLQAGAYARGGEIFILNMGEPVKILEMAEKLIRLSGYEPYKEIDIKITGLRPGEKLYEELLMEEEGLRETKNNRIYIGRPIEMDYEKFEEGIRKLGEAAWEESGEIRSLVKELVPEYHPEAHL